MERYNIYQRRDGRWEGRISKGKGKNGKRRFQYFFGHSRDEVRDRMNKIQSYKSNQKDCSKTISEVFDEWYQSIQHRVKESTAANYFMKAHKHILSEFGNKAIDSIHSNDIYKFIELKRNQQLSNRYIADILILMKSIFKHAVKVYHVFNPLDGIILPKKKSPEIQLLDANEQTRLSHYIAENHNNTTLGIALAMSTGIRIGELCALQWRDINLEKRILTVRKTIQRIQTSIETSRTKLIITEPKSESSKRCIPIPECMISLLEKFKAGSETFILSSNENPIEPRTMQYRFAKILKNVKLPSIHFHAIRHMFASNCVNLGFDIKALSELLGHSSVEITLNRYVHSAFEQKIKYMNRLKSVV